MLKQQEIQPGMKPFDHIILFRFSRIWKIAPFGLV